MTRLDFRELTLTLNTLSPLSNPEEIDNAIKWLVSSNKTDDEDRPEDTAPDAIAEDVKFNATNAIVSNLAFIAVMPGSGCLYVARSDF